MKVALRYLVTAGLLAATAPALAAEYKTAVAQVLAAGRTVTLGGTVVPYKQVVLSARIPGQIKSIAGVEGDSFKAGTPLFAISDADIQARRRAAWAQILAARSRLRNAQVQYQREYWSPSINNGTSRSSGFGLPSMFDQMFTRPMSNSLGMSNTGMQRYSDLQRRYSGINQARSTLLAAQARLQELDVNLSDARQLAPFDGIIIQKMVEAGTTVQPGTPILKYAFVGYLRIKAEVPVRLVSALRTGKFVNARVDAAKPINVKARIAQIFPVADQTRHTVTVKFDLPKGIAGGPGMYAEVLLPDPDTSLKGLPVVPASAIILRGSLPAVYVLKDGKPSLRLVRIGPKQPDGRISIISGIAEGETVIIEPAKVDGNQSRATTGAAAAIAG